MDKYIARKVQQRKQFEQYIKSCSKSDIKLSTYDLVCLFLLLDPELVLNTHSKGGVAYVADAEAFLHNNHLPNRLCRDQSGLVNELLQPHSSVSSSCESKSVQETQ